MKRYESYKPSGVEWIGDIPAHWQMVMFKFLAGIEGGKDYKEYVVDEGGFPVYGTGGEFARCSKFLFNGDLSILLGRKGTVDNPIIVKGPFWTSDTVYYTLIRDIIKCRFLFFLVKQIPFELYTYGSAIPSMTKTDYEEMVFPLPPLPEQSQIVAYLDRKTALIDSLIAKTERKIALLKEKRTALINQAVTKGLDPNVKMKDSGVEWIGEIPEQWGLIRLKYCGVFLTGFPWKSANFDYDSGLKILRGENVSEGFLRWGARARYWKESVDSDSQYFLMEDDIIVPMDGSKVGRNHVRITKEDLPILLHQRMCRLRPYANNVKARLIEYWISSTLFHYYIDISKTDPMVPHITQKNVEDFLIALPPKDEQGEIIEYLGKELFNMDKSLSIAKRQIEKLKEYRQALISEVVTGKIKVSKDV